MALVNGGYLYYMDKKKFSHGTFMPSMVQIGPAVWEEMFKEIVDDGHSTTLNASLEHVVLR